MDYQIGVCSKLSAKNRKLYDGILRLTDPINETYPAHTKWFVEKFLPELKDGKRKIVVAYQKIDEPLGVCLLKDTPDEKKICTLFVDESCRRQGIAAELIRASFEVLQTKSPLITVSDTNLAQLQPLLDKFEFQFSYKKKGAYLAENTEMYYNNPSTEALKNKVLSPLFAYWRRNERNG